MSSVADIKEHCNERINQQRSIPDIDPESAAGTGIPLPFRNINVLEKKLKVSDEQLNHNQRLLTVVGRVMESVGRLVDEKTRASDYNYTGRFTLVGSSRDGTRPGNIMELDYLFITKLETKNIVLYESKRSKAQHEYKVYEAYDEEEDEIQPSMLNESFRHIINEVFLNNYKLPEGLVHAGFAHPEYSGARRNGPATTLLFKWNDDFVSIDITLAFELPAEDEDKYLELVKSKIEPIQKDNPETTFDLARKVHLVPKNPDEKVWQLTTSMLEAQLVHQLHDKAPVKRIIKLHKIIAEFFENKAERAARHNAQKSTEEPDMTSALKDLLKWFSAKGKKDEELRRDLMKVLQYAHIYLPVEEAKIHQELPKRIMSIKSYAIKHLALVKGALIPGSFSPKDDKRALELLIASVFSDLAEEETHSVKHFFLNTDISVYSWAAYGPENRSKYITIAKGQCQRIVEKFQQRNSIQTAFAQRQALLGDLPWTFLCRGCRNFAFTTESSRKYVNHLLIIDKEFHEKIKIKEFKGSKKFEDNYFDKTHDMFCSICGHEWGILTNFMDLYKSVPLVKIRNFLFMPSNCPSNQALQIISKISTIPSDTFKDISPAEYQQFPPITSD